MTQEQLNVLILAMLVFTPIILFVVFVYTMRVVRNMQLIRAYRAEIIDKDKYGYPPMMIMLHLKYPVDHQGNSIFIGDILPGRQIEETSVQQALTVVYMEYDVGPHKYKLW